jgi:cytochrome c553
LRRNGTVVAYTAVSMRCDAARIARGKTIYEQALAAVGVPTCGACHGPDGHGAGDFPRLAGQHAQFGLKQLNPLQSNMRNVAVM